MERTSKLGAEAFVEANRGKNILSVTQTVLTPEYKKTTYNQNLIVATPNELKLSKNIYSTFTIWRLSDGQEIRELHQGLRLENSILHHSKTGQIVLLFDTDDLNFPYLVYLVSKGLLNKPFNFTQFDAHVDIESLGSEPPKTRNLSSILEFHQKSVGIANFMTALSATGFLGKINHINHSKLMAFSGWFPPEVYSNVKKHGVGFNFINPYFWLYNKLTRLFKNNEPSVLAFDIDFFGDFASGTNKPVQDVINIWLTRIKESGYSSQKAPVVCIATSPGFNDGFKDDEEKLEVVKQIIDQLTLH